MSNLSQSDLILAGRFVDGDLPAHDAAQAEARIAKDADFAAAVEQIRDQRSLLGRLPKFAPPEDLADRTLQASMDQVKAIMGAWPIESDIEKVTVAAGSGDSTSKPFDWKSTAALIASLAGVFMIGTMLWQQNNQSASDLAMNETPTASSKAGFDDDDDSMLVQSPGKLESVEMDSAAESIAADEVQPSSVVARNARDYKGAFGAPGVALSGTPMTPRKPAQTTAATNASSPVSQIWCVRQDSTASKDSVSEILKLNRIAVRSEEQPPAEQPADIVEAFYVAATPTQMNLAMSQISNNADIEMIKIPTGADSPITDAILQQYTQSNAVPKADNAAPTLNKENMPSSFEPTQALAQQLVSNAFPRNFSLGPVPPILKSGDQIDGLDKAPGGIGENDIAAVAPKAPSASKSGAGFGSRVARKKMPAAEAMPDAEAMVDAAAVQQQRQTLKSTLSARQQAQLDQYINDDPNQLKQYLILVRGGEERRSK